ncbi:hypothetical protein [Ferrimonas balearica]|uniref:hypothetical protein n=1 Tax=Ferrimonas balearica TaxID=44012 RepID=UPI001C99E0A3|nr:hypothetical protein [Ferrimonas balearica]MBY5991817.1 hypothetical protein [Ferrimonas balearica]
MSANSEQVRVTIDLDAPHWPTASGVIEENRASIKGLTLSLSVEELWDNADHWPRPVVHKLSA